jgi:hypothetical protein
MSWAYRENTVALLRIDTASAFDTRHGGHDSSGAVASTIYTTQDRDLINSIAPS